MFAKLKAALALVIKSLKRQKAGPASPPACHVMVESIHRDVGEMLHRALGDCHNRPHDTRPRTARLIVVCTPAADLPDRVDIEVDARYQPPTNGLPLGRLPSYCDRSAN